MDSHPDKNTLNIEPCTGCEQKGLSHIPSDKEKQPKQQKQTQTQAAVWCRKNRHTHTKTKKPS